MITLLLLVVVPVVLMSFALLAARSRSLDLSTAPAGGEAPGHGPMQISNVQGGLYDGSSGANTPQGRGSPHAHLVGATTPVGGGDGPPCSTTTLPNCLGGCGTQQPSSNWVKAQTIAASLLTAGSDVTVDLEGVPNVDAQGRHAHVVGIRFVGTHRFVLGATNDAYAGYQQLAAWTRIFLEIAGWQFLASVDARTLVDDRWLRSFSESAFDAPPADIAANAGAGNVDVDVTTYYPLTRPYAGGLDALQGCIPLRALQNFGESALRFGAPASLVGAPAGITPDGFQGLTEIWLELVYLPKVVNTRPWQVETYTDTQMAGNLRRPERTCEYGVMRNFPEDNGGQYPTGYDGATFQVAGQTIASALTEAQWRTRTASTMDEDPRWVDPTPSLIVAGVSRMLFIVGPLPRRIPGMAAGPVGWQFSARTATQTRFLLRTLACQQADALRGLDMAGSPMVSIDHQDNTVAPDKMYPIVVGK